MVSSILLLPTTYILTTLIRLIGPMYFVVVLFGLSLLSPAMVEAFAGILPAVTALLAVIAVEVSVALAIITT